MKFEIILFLTLVLAYFIFIYFNKAVRKTMSGYIVRVYYELPDYINTFSKKIQINSHVTTGQEILDKMGFSSDAYGITYFVEDSIGRKSFRIEGEELGKEIKLKEVDYIKVSSKLVSD